MRTGVGKAGELGLPFSARGCYFYVGMEPEGACVRELIQKIIEAGLLDRQTARLFEMWKALPDGVEAMARRVEKLKAATPMQLRVLAEEVAELVDAHLDRLPRETVVDLPTEFPLRAHVSRKIGVGTTNWVLPAALFGGSVIVRFDGTLEQVPRYGDQFSVAGGSSGRVNLTTLVSDELAVVETGVPRDWA